MWDWTTTATTLHGRSTRRSAVLTLREFEFAAKYWDIGELGDMHHNPAKNVLHVKQTLEEMAAQTGGDSESLRALRDATRAKLLAARIQRPTPFIDRTLYTGWNAMAVTAYLETARVLRMDSRAEFALRTLDRLLSEAWDGEATLRHVIAYPEIGAARAAKVLPGRSTIMHLRFMPASMRGLPAAR